MLVLTRKVGEKLLIGKDIEVMVTRVAGGRVTLGVAAPRDLRVSRGEKSLEPESDDAPEA